MAIGMKASSTGSANDFKTGNRARTMITKVKKIIRKYGLDDKSWAEAISSQYFLLCLAKQLKLEKHDYENLINKCLKPFRVTYEFELVLDDKEILITPEETDRITKCMQEEDEKDSYYKRSAKMQAVNINPQLMYQNFHFGLLVRNATTKESDVLNKVKTLCLNRLVSDESIDTSGGWYPYRVPWITGRILISLKAIDFSQYQNADKLDEIIDDAIDSLYQRINEDYAYWRSGVGDWVTKWESTALCLEALYVWDSMRDHLKEIERIITYVCNEEQRQEWLECKVDFSEAKSANAVLSAVTLASVVYRVTKQFYPESFERINEEIIAFFYYLITQIDKQGVYNVQQYCTLPQILHYVVAAFETDGEEVVI